MLSVAAPMLQCMTYAPGKLMSRHKQLSRRKGIAVYICDSHSPWQHVSNENMNMLVHQYFPRAPTTLCTAKSRSKPLPMSAGVRSPLAVYRDLLLSNTTLHTLSIKPKVLHFRFESAR